MQGFTPEGSFGQEAAAHYDDSERGDEGAAVEFLQGAAGHGPALEFAIGTGRIVLPLHTRGVRVDCIELSEDMIAVLRRKEGGSDLDVWAGDMTSTRTGRRYSLVYLVYNTIFNLLTQNGQVACFRNAAAHLADDGVFVVEAAVPSAWLPSHSYVRPERVRADSVDLDVCQYDPATQILDENHVCIGASGASFGPISCRLAWPSELDLMTRLVGLRVAERWGGWHREPYTGHDQHVSVYGLA